MCTKIAGTYYDPNAPCPRWEQFLGEVLPDLEVRAWLQRWIGSCLTGITTDRVVVLFVGIGKNGKSVLVDVLLHVLGGKNSGTTDAAQGYGLTVAKELFVHRRGESASPWVYATLPGSRLAVVVEFETGDHLDSEGLKRISGGDSVSAARKFGHPFTFTPQCKLVALTNHRPRVTDATASIWDRLRIVDFPRRFDGEAEDRALLGKLLDEAPGILRWAVDGCRLWQRDGLGEAQAVLLATEELRREEDELADFFEGWIDIKADLTSTVADLYRAYCDWCEAEKNPRPKNKRAFGAALRDRGFRCNKGSPRVWYGLGVRGGQPQQELPVRPSREDW